MTLSSGFDSQGDATLLIERAAAPLRRRVVDQLRQAIIEGRLKPGQRLLERELIALTGVSRTVIRETLRQLESEGLISMIPNKGPIVRALTRAEAEDLYAIRAVLEGLAARLFATRSAAPHLARLQQALAATARAYSGGDPDRVLAAKNGFYDALCEGAGSETLSAMLASLHGRIRRWRALGLSHPQRAAARSNESIRNLRAVIGAIEQHDGDRAERLMVDEVRRAATEVTRLIGHDAAAPARSPAAGTGSQ
ncbi:MAG: GntR family transcriptional regulator [Acidobacteriota bacterium]